MRKFLLNQLKLHIIIGNVLRRANVLDLEKRSLLKFSSISLKIKTVITKRCKTYQRFFQKYAFGFVDKNSS